MPPNGENVQNQDVVMQAKQEVRERARAIEAEEAGVQALQKQQFARELTEELEQRTTAAEEVSMLGTEGRVIEAQQIKTTVAKVLEGINQGIIENVPENARKFFAELSRRGLTNQSAARLHGFVQKYLSQDKDISFSAPGQPATEFEQDFEALSAIDPFTARLIRETILVAPGDYNVTPEIAEERLQITLPDQEEIRRRVAGYREPSDFEGLWETYLQPFYDETDKATLQALASPEAFYSFVGDLQLQRIDELVASGELASRAAFNDPANEELRNQIGRRVSEDIEREIVLKFSKLYLKVDLEKPTQFFEEIIQEGFYTSIQTVHTNLKRRFDLLVQELTDHPVPEELKSLLEQMKFFKSFSVQALGEKEVEVDGETKSIPQYRILPTAGSKEVIIRDFLRSVGVQIDHEVNTRKYLHNVKALFYRGAQGEEGFWRQLGNYATNLTTTDIDAMALLPDHDLFMAASQLYTKYINEAFAEVSWVHQPNMFSTDLLDNYSKIEQNVLNDLKGLFPDISGLEKDDWRFRRAMSMAIGLSRGVLLTEAELAAWADPHITPESGGGPTYTSYYTNDNAALTALNPLHHFLRWQTESVLKGPLLFMVTSGFDPSMRHVWNHKELWDRAKEFQKTFIEGLKAFGERRPEERFFAELLPNIGRGGSIISRGGWRTPHAFEGWVVRDEKLREYTHEGQTERVPGGRIKYLESWKSLENIGYHAINDFVLSYIESGDYFKDIGAMEPGAAAESYKSDRYALEDYLYQKYLGGALGGFDTYRAGLRAEVESEVKRLFSQKHRIGMTKAEFDKDYEKNIETEVSKRIIYRSLARMLHQRVPTKFMLIERDRQTPDGIRAWEKLRKANGWDFETMDNTVKTLLRVETVLRQRTSQRMKEHLRNYETLADIGDPEYQITNGNIGQLLDAIGARGAMKNNALALFDKINEHITGEYLDKTIAEQIRVDRGLGGTERIRKIPFALAPEELDISFLAYRNAGPGVLARALNDTGRVEKDIAGNLIDYISKLQQTSINEKRDFSELIKHLDAAKRAMDEVHGKEYAEYVAYQFASMTIAYFKKDTVGKNIFAKLFTLRRRNSLAAEFVPGAFRGVWEWEAKDIRDFIIELQRNNILRRESYDLLKGPTKKGGITIPFTGGRLKIGEKEEYPLSTPYCTNLLAKDLGGTKKHLALEFFNKYLPIILGFVLFMYIQKSLRESIGQKK